MEAFTQHTGRIIPLDRANVDTDAIIPKNFMKKITRTGFGENAFNDWRFLEDGSPNPDFPMNQAPFRGGSVLVARNNFGCGSSREHAVWAIVQAGFRVIIAPRKITDSGVIPGFADIFRNNSVKNGLLTVELSESEVQVIFDAVAAEPGLEAAIDLESQQLTLRNASAARFGFEIDAASKHQLLNGLDEIALSLTCSEAIAAFEAKHDTQL